MPFYNQEEIEKARQVDSFTYLRTRKPQELVHVSGDVYALAYLIKVNGCSFMEAVASRASIPPP